MITKYKPQQVIYAIDTYKNKTSDSEFYRIEKAIIVSIYIDINEVTYWLKNPKDNQEWGNSITENMIFASKELASKKLLKLCNI